MSPAILLLQAAPDYDIGSANSELLHYVKLVSVLGLILAVTFMVLHVALPRIPGVRRLGAGPIRVAARLPLEPKKNLYVIRVGADYYLVGTSESGMHYLTALDKERIEAALDAEAPPESEFATLVQAFRRRKGSS